jgi:N-acetylmuramoyl-L-alanine amidase
MQHIRFVLLTFLLLVSTNLYSTPTSDKFFYAKKNYVTAVLRNDKQKEIKYLKQLVRYGSELDRDISKYKKELRRLDRSINISKLIKKKPVKSSNKKYSIKDVYSDGNSVVIEFNHKVSKKYLKYFERKSKNKYYDIFELRGNFKDASPTKLSIDGVDRVKIVQLKQKTLRISFKNRYNLKTVYIFNGNKIIIKVKPKKSIKFTKSVNKQVSKNSKKYSIKSVYTDDDSIVVAFNHKVSKKHLKYFERKSKNKYYDIFELKGNFKDASPTKLAIDGIDRIKIVQYRHKTLRISIADSYNVKTYYIFNGKKIIIRTKPKKNNKTKSSKQYISVGKQKNIVDTKKTIVIDAGHGGKDPGAVGPRGEKEKIVILNIAKDLYKNLKAKGYRVYLTRNRDRYVSLRYRTRLANKKNADIFISIHANAARKARARKAKGIETYFLSPARSKRAKRVAALENKGDMNSMSYSSQNILLTLLNRSKIISSQKMAIDIQSHMLHSLRKHYGKKIIDGGVREGPFWVLVGAQMPAVLVEVGYISHPTESRRLASRAYQKRIATGIANGVMSYFANNP